MIEELLTAFVEAILPAISRGLLALVQGGSMDDAYARTIEALENQRAKAKFETLEVDSET